MTRCNGELSKRCNCYFKIEMLTALGFTACRYSDLMLRTTIKEYFNRMLVAHIITNHNININNGIHSCFVFLTHVSYSLFIWVSRLGTGFGIVTMYFSISIPLLPAWTYQQLTLRRSPYAEALQAIVSEVHVLAQGSYVAARAGFEPATIVSTNVPPRPTMYPMLWF